MKLRIKGNSIRMRLTKTEVAQIKNGEPVQETLSFGGGAKLHYTLEPTHAAHKIEAKFDGKAVRVSGPHAELTAWANGSSVAIKNILSIDDQESLSILIEKDFFCLKPRIHETEDESDMFDNPNLAHGSCS